MNLLATPFAAFSKKKKHVDLTMDDLDDGRTDVSSSKLTSGYSAQESTSPAINIGKWRKNAGYCLAGLAVLSALVSMIYLPIILLVPTKFCLLFSIALASASLSLLLLQGVEYMKTNFFTGSIRYYTVALLLTNLISLFMSYGSRSAIICLVLSVVQFVSLTYVLLFNVAYGKQFLDSIYGGIGRCFRNLAVKLATRTN